MAEAPPAPMNPNALPLPVAAQLLSKAGARLITENMLREDVEAGAPTNADGSLNLVHYAAWLVKEMTGRSDGD